MWVDNGLIILGPIAAHHKGVKRKGREDKGLDPKETKTQKGTTMTVAVTASFASG